MVRDFIDANPDEIVIVDIHVMSAFGDTPYNTEAQRDLILSVFQTQVGSYLIGLEHYGKSLNQMYAELSPKQRVILAWSTKVDRDKPFWPMLNQ